MWGRNQDMAVNYLIIQHLLDTWGSTGSREREREREGGWEGGREGERKGGREGEREGGVLYSTNHMLSTVLYYSDWVKLVNNVRI